jgi:hypothetical protein
VFQKPKHPVQRFTSKVAGSHPQLRGWFCPQIDMLWIPERFGRRLEEAECAEWNLARVQ